MGWTIDDMPDQRGRIALVTGANSGLGLETTRALLKAGATVLMACRSRRKGKRPARNCWNWDPLALTCCTLISLIWPAWRPAVMR